MSRPEFVQSLERGLSVIRCFDADNARLTLAEVAQRTGLTRATARRLLLTLGELGYVSTNGRHFSLTPRVLDIGYAYLSSLNIEQIAQPYLEALSERVNESVSVTVLDGADIIYVAHVPTKRIMTISLGLGSRLPAYCTSMGRVLLAELHAGAARRHRARAARAADRAHGGHPRASSRRCSPTSASRGGRSSTRSSRWGSGRSPRPCATPWVAPWPP